MAAWLGSFFGGGGGAAAAPKAPPSARCLRRIANDLRALEKDDFLFACVTDDADATRVDACILGLAGTPYDGGCFHFKVEFPTSYPVDNPKIELVTTGDGSIGFNPNLYANGKVCLSILGTWAGPSWSPTQSLSSVLLSIQSLLHDRPYTNEPGREAASDEACASYNDFVRYATLKYAVARNLDPTSAQHGAMPPPMRRFYAEAFLKRYDALAESVAAEIAAGRDGAPFRDPTGRSTAAGATKYAALAADLAYARAAATTRLAAEDAAEAEEAAAEEAAEAAAATGAPDTATPGAPPPSSPPAEKP